VTHGSERNQATLMGDCERGGGEGARGDGIVKNGKSRRKNIILTFEGWKRR
jgi:hypothetical protein